MSEDRGPGAWIRPEIRELRAYHVPPAEGLIKLDAMENPYPWPGALPEELTRAWLDSLRGLQLNRYPDASATALAGRLRAFMEVPDDASVLLGNGSDELIQMLMLAVAGPGRSVLAPAPSFSMYGMIARFAGLGCHEVPLDEDFQLDVPAMESAIREHRPALVMLAYPNNPTGNLFAAEDIDRILAAAPGLVVIDEAYQPFAEVSFMPRAGREPGLAVLRTVSKLGLAGLRLGILAGPADWLTELDKLRLPYNVNSLTQATAGFALEHAGPLAEQAARLREERERLTAELDARDGIRVFPSRANFLLLRCPGGTATALHEGVLARGVLIKNLHGSHPRLADCLRVTVGTPEENTRFLEALDDARRRILP